MDVWMENKISTATLQIYRSYFLSFVKMYFYIYTLQKRGKY